ncbi:Mediator of RNA polymerase II transcription subunit 21 [Parelaphostrongylus tenuis]|uniref:Mediator of RNA polymerase II transcription subunit 21 n=1 Tax=Parelaphostrongylus tenuis TaxID=148309 RepID=A0AAD5WH68_PARTN|nr:Mediator of RNA polymerase II transcription subunit 21 [Parelaphostrongylus tenuis]
MESASENCDKISEARERYLRFLANLAGCNVTVSVHEGTNVKGLLVAMKGDGSHFLVDRLETPIGIMESAVLRTADTIMMTIDWDDVNRHK